jgi:ceramide glucosyltransferase
VIWLALPAWAAAAYYLLALWAALRWCGRKQHQACGAVRAISVLKPVHGRDPRFYDAIASHARQDHPNFELLFGVSDPEDSALEDIRRLQHEFPAVPIEVHVVATKAPNAKAGVLAELSRRARHPLLLVNDGDIRVEPDYLRSVATPLEDPSIGLVTCLYRARAESPAARAEALGIATEFAPSVLVARLLGVAEFALGSTMVFRTGDLRAAGGFEAIECYLADDYQLGRHINELGLRIEFSPVVVETDLGGGSWRETCLHQLRWSRTIRVSRPSGYFGYVVTHATLWSLVALAAGAWPAAAAAFGMRMAAGMVTGAGILRDRRIWSDFWMIPLRDLFGFAVWLCGLYGDEVEWRGQRLKLRRDGKIGGARSLAGGRPKQADAENQQL